MSTFAKFFRQPVKSWVDADKGRGASLLNSLVQPLAVRAHSAVLTRESPQNTETCGVWAAGEHMQTGGNVKSWLSRDVAMTGRKSAGDKSQSVLVLL